MNDEFEGFWQNFWDCAQFLLARHLMYKKYNRIFKFSYFESFYQRTHKVDGNGWKGPNLFFCKQIKFR